MTHEKEVGRSSPGNNVHDDLTGSITTPAEHAGLGRIYIRGNTFVNASGNTALISTRFREAYPERRETFFSQWLHTSNNHYLAVPGYDYFGAHDYRGRYGRAVLPKPE